MKQKWIKKDLLMFAALLIVGCAEDITINNGNGQFIAFRVSEAGVATVTDDPVTGTTRMSEFVPSNGLFSPSVYPLSRESVAQTSVAQPIESDFKEPLFMTVTTEPLSHKASTRGTEISSFTSGDKISVTAYLSATPTAAEFANQDAEYKTDNLFHTTKPWGSSASTNYDFYAWHPASLTGSKNSAGLSFSSEKTITYDITGLASSAMPDLLGGTALSKNYALKNDGSVDLTFSHLLTPVRFQLASGFDGTITSIKFENIVTKADHTIGMTHATYGCDWTTNTTPGDWTSQTLNTTGDPSSAKQVDEVDGTEYFMMIPQTIAGGTVVTIGLTAGGNNYTLQYATPSDLVWKAGELVTYTISATALTVYYPCQANAAKYLVGSDYEGCGWYKGNGMSKTMADYEDGPYSAYTASDHFGLFAVDPSTNQIVISNLDVTGQAGGSFSFFPSSLTNASRPTSYRYFLMYPYVSDLITTYPALAQGQTSTAIDAENFFTAVIAGWQPITNQSAESDFKAQDLQIGTLSSTDFVMKHQMGILAAPHSPKVYDDIVVYDGDTYNSSGTPEKWTRISAECTTLTWDVSTNYSSTNKAFDSTVKSTLYYIAKPADNTIALTTSINASSQKYGFDKSDPSETTITSSDQYLVFDIEPGDYDLISKKVWKFEQFDGSKWVAPETTTYNFQLWGASGGGGSAKAGSAISYNLYGRGAYVAGDIDLDVDQSLWVYIGGQGGTANNAPGGKNGGGPKGIEANDGSGGGATDVTLSEGNSYYRIIVAAGGGGSGDGWGTSGWWSSNPTEDYYITLASAGGLWAPSDSKSNYSQVTAGASQTASTTISNGKSQHSPGPHLGSFDGANTEAYQWESGGGGGYWGGCGSDIIAYGGSCYISGHPGCVAIKNASSTDASTAGTENSVERSKHFSGLYFKSNTTVMIDGAGYSWTTTRGSKTAMPEPDGGTVSDGYGHTGDGYCIITQDITL